MGITCIDIEGTVQAIEGSQLCCKTYKVCLWSNTSEFVGSLFGTGYDWVARCQCPEDEGRPKHRRFTKDRCGVNLRNDLTIH